MRKTLHSLDSTLIRRTNISMPNKPPMTRDYKNRIRLDDVEVRQQTSRYWIIIVTSFLLLGSAIYLFPGDTSSLTNADDQPLIKPIATSAPMLSMPLTLPDHDVSESENASDLYKVANQQWRTVKVRNGDNLALIFSRMDLSPKLLHDLLSSSKKAKRLKHLVPGQAIKFLFTDFEFTALVHEVSKTRQLRIDRINDSDGRTFTASVIDRTPEVRMAHASGTINSSLYMAAQDAELPDNLIMELANIFGWDIDFALDIRKGDSFVVAYEELFLDGEKIRNGDIVAAKFINNKKTFRAVQYTNPENKTGYYTPEGRNMRKAFLRTPVDFTRISSRFGKRFHPVLNRMRAHKGVDYAAPRGTPIKTTGDGKILFKGRKGGYGKAIIVQHGSGKQTLYAHMSGYKRGIRRGKSVKQGQTIGFVGSTGRATGPHLHYEFRINGVHRNPLTIKFASAKPVPKKFMTDFNAKTSEYVALLDIVGSNFAFRSP